jgi:hypothetical protein
VPTEAIVNLEQLGCTSLKDFETRVEPYIWPALVKIDSNTINAADGRRVDVIVPSSANAQVKIDDSMVAGETVPIPSSVGTLRARFANGSSNRQLILIVALLEMDDTPHHAMRTGFRSYATELRAAFKEEFNNLFGAGNDEEELKLITDRIKKRVERKVSSSVEDALSFGEKVKANFQGQDDLVGSAFARFTGDPLKSARINLAYENKGTVAISFNPPINVETVVRYKIQGRFRVSEL